MMNDLQEAAEALENCQEPQAQLALFHVEEALEECENAVEDLEAFEEEHFSIVGAQLQGNSVDEQHRRVVRTAVNTGRMLSR